MRRGNNEPRIYGPYEHGDIWRLHWVTKRPNGTRKTEYTTHATRDEADRVLAGARDEAQGTTVKIAVSRFLDKKRSKGLADTTIENYEDRLNRLLGLPGNANRPIRWLNGRGASLYQASIRGASDTHINGLNVGRMFGNWCVKERLLKVSPFADVEPVGRKRLGADKERLTVDESRKLQDHCLAKCGQYEILTLAYLWLGTRASELVKRSVRDLDDNGRLLWIGKTKSKAGRRRLELPGTLSTLLLDLVRGKAPDDPIFVNYSGKRMSRYSARDRVKAVCKAAGVPVLPPQALRRTVATLATDAGAIGPLVARHLGHESDAITHRAYIERDAAADAKRERAFKVIAGGRR